MLFCLDRCGIIFGQHITADIVKYGLDDNQL